MRRDSGQSRQSWFRKKSAQGPVIVVNGVTYGSPDEIPAHLRPVWDANIRDLEERGIDWRLQRSIALTWSHAGNVVSQSFSIEGAHHHSPSQPPAFASVLLAGYYICWVALTFYGLWWNVPPLIFDFSSGLLYALAGLLYGSWVGLFVNAVRKRRQLARQRSSGQEDFLAAFQSRHDILLQAETPAWKLAGTALVGLAGIAIITYFAVFGGATKLLHYAERKPGETTAVVTATRAYARGRSDLWQCLPWIALDGFRFTGERLCVNSDFHQRVNVGDRIRLTGMMSRYAMDPERIEIVVDD